MAKKTAKKRKEASKKHAKKQLSDAHVDSGASFQEQDPKRRLGNFTTAGEHARQGGRNSGIVGQTKQRNKTDKRSKKK